MSRTQLTGNQVLDGSVKLADLNTTTTGSAVVTKIAAGTGMAISSTGVDAGTGTVTVSTSGPANAGGSNLQIQYNNSGILDGNAVITIDATDKNLLLDMQSSGTSIAAPTTQSKMLSRSVAGRTMLGQLGPVGGEYQFQPLLSRLQVQFWQAQGNGTATSAFNWGIFTAAGTATARNVIAPGAVGFNLFTSMKRISYVSATTAGNSAGIRHGEAQYCLGNGASNGGGGFMYVTRFGFATTPTALRFAVGLFATTAALTNVNPSTLLNAVYVGQDTGQTTLHVMSNDGSGTATGTDLGANFPSNTANTDMYEVIFYTPPNGTGCSYRVERLNTGHIAEGTISTANLPADTILLNPQAWVNTGTGSGIAATLDITGQWIETEK